MTLPVATTASEFTAIRRDESALRPGVDEILARHRIEGEVVRFADGSLPVYAIGEHVLKLFPPAFASEHTTETTVLAAVSGKLSIPTPSVDLVGELAGWRYVVMSKLRGESLALAWPRIGESDRTRLMAELGQALATLHAIRDPALDALEPRDWDAFIATQRVNAVEKQRSKGLDDVWVAQVPGFLESVALSDSRRVLLHTEVMREHLLVEEGPGGWRLSGLFDFEPAMCGAPEYELASVGVFVSCGDPQLLRTLLRAYGYREDQLDDELSRRILAYAILHRYSHLRWYLERLPPVEELTLHALARRGWGTR